MTLITLEELARGVSIALGGGLAGTLTISMPGSPLWLIPATGAVVGCALTVPEVRTEIAKALPLLTEARQLLPAPHNGERRAQPVLDTITTHTQGQPPADHHETTTNTADHELFDHLESTPHRLIIGHTRGGKTTLMHHLGTTWAERGERVLVADPDAAPGLWPGCEVAGHGDDLASITTLLEQVAIEVRQRRELRKQGVRTFQPLHLVIDEAQDVIPDIEGARDLFEDIARRGGKLNIRMTIGVQDKLVGTLGLEGKSEILRNLQVADVLKNRQGQRVAVLRDAETGAKISMAIPPLRDPETLIRPVETEMPTQPIRTMHPVTPKPAPIAYPVTPSPAVAEPTQQIHQAEADDLLAALLAESVSSASERDYQAHPVPSTRPHDDGNGNGHSHTQVTVTPGGHTPIVNVYAHASTGSSPQHRTKRGRGLDIKARRARTLKEQKQATLRQAYAEARAAGVPSFRQAYQQIGGNRQEALAAWQAAASHMPKLSA